MSIKTNLENELKNAMREKDEIKKRTIRLALSSIKNAEIDKGIELDDASILSILQKEIKTRRETITDAQKINRQDLIEELDAEIKIVQQFMPQGLSQEELTGLIVAAIQEVNASGLSDLGKIMKVVMPKIQGRASGSDVTSIATKILAA